MDREHRPPLSVFGIPLKPLIFAIALLLALLIVIERRDIEPVVDKLSAPAQQHVQTESRTKGGDIVATPEMLAKAQREIIAEKLKNVETAEQSTSTDRFFYIIELQNGDDLEAVDVVIKPDTVTIISAGGTKTTIPRTDVKKLNRIKLGDPD